MVIKYFEKVKPTILLRISFNYNGLYKNDFARVSVVHLKNTIKIYILSLLKAGHAHDIDVYTYF